MRRNILLISLAASYAAVTMAEIPWPEQNIWPESPQAQAIRQAMMPTPALLTGAVEFSLPLYEIETEGFSLPVSLEYRSNGIKPTDDPQPIGYGWVLSPPLRIARQIMGLPDEYFHYAGDDPFDSFTNDYMKGYNTMHLPEIFDAVYHDNYNDTQRDIFTIYLPDRTLTMMYDGKTLVGPACDEYRVECGDLLTYIKVTDPSGTIYDFSLDGESIDNPIMRTEWMLTSITLPSGNMITIGWDAWDHMDRRVKTYGPRTVFYNEGEYRFEPGETEYGDFHRYYFTQNLSSISFPGGTLTCTYSSSSGSKMLGSVTVSNGTKNVRTVSLTHDGMLLSDVDISGEGRYSFSYNTGRFLSSTSLDWWGFHNGKDNRSRLDPTVVMNWSQDGTFAGADRSVDVEAMKANILTKVTYPNGGSVEWEYEPHKFPPQSSPAMYRDIYKNCVTLSEGGGLRVKKMTMRESDSDPSPVERSYIYGENCNGLANIETAPLLNTFIRETAMEIFRNGRYSNELAAHEDNCMVINRESDYLTGQTGIPSIWYPQVTEMWEEGKKEYHFENICGSNIVEYSEGFNIPMTLYTAFSQGPQMRSVTTYRSDGSGYKAVEREEMDYETIPIKGMEEVGGNTVYRTLLFFHDPVYAPDYGPQQMKIVDPIIVNTEWEFIPSLCRFQPELYQWFFAQPMVMHTRTERLTGSRHITYHDNGTRTVSQTNTYLDGTMLPKSIVTSCGGETVTETFGYSGEHDTSVSSAMETANVRTACTVTTTYGTSTSGYSLEMAQWGNVFKPARIWQTRGSTKWSTSAYTYDTKGNLTKMTGTDGTVSSWTWDTYGNPLTMTYGSDLTSTATWERLVGVTSLTEPSGVKTSFTYDTAGRLLSRSLNSRVTERHTYTTGRNVSTNVRTQHLTSSTASYSTYLCSDGLGRKRSEVTQLPSSKYAAKLTTYDGMGRVAEEWEAAPLSSSPLADDSSVKEAARSFYGEQHPYTLTGYEASPRELETSRIGSGDAWHSAGKKSLTERLTNDLTTHVCIRYEATSSGVTSKGNYPAGALEVEIYTDEDGVTVERYTDFRGNMVCRKEAGKATSFVYDGYGDLRYILPPGVSGTQLRTSDAMRKIAYWYDYDSRGRLTVRKIPGVKEARLVYDPADRIVAEQTWNHPDGSWRFYGYDSAGRKVVTIDCPATDAQVTSFASQCRTVQLSQGGVYAGYTLAGLPAGGKVVTAEYYDSYSFINYNSLPQDFVWSGIVQSGSFAPAGTVSKGLLTGICTGAGFEAYYYNRDGQIIERYATGYNIGRVRYSYTYSGKISTTEWTLPDGTVSRMSYTYDTSNRLISLLAKPLGSDNTHTTTITYDEAGRVSSTSGGALSRTFTRNSRGWLTTSKTTTGKTTLQEILTYTYNGNVKSRRGGAGSYDFTYDNRNRLIAASSPAGENDFSTRYGYDDRGNMTSLVRRGVVDKVGGTEIFGTLDSLHMELDGNLVVEIDASSERKYFNGITGLASRGKLPLEFDSSGRLIYDDDREIESIEYDNNGHPVRIEFFFGDIITYEWDGMGNLLRTTCKTNVPDLPGQPDLKNLYVWEYYGDGRVILDGELAYARMPGGYMSDGEFYRYVTDYQGNNVAVVDKDGNVVQQTGYYPYGEPWREPSGQPYLYSDKERFRWESIREYDFGARRHWAAMCMFTTPDPLTELTPWVGPAVFCLDNPLRYTDPSGMFASFEEAQRVALEYGNPHILWDPEKEEWFLSLNASGTGPYRTGAEAVRLFNSKPLLSSSILQPDVAKYLLVTNSTSIGIGTSTAIIEAEANRLLKKPITETFLHSANSSEVGKMLGNAVGKYHKITKYGSGILSSIGIAYSAYHLITYGINGGSDPWVYVRDSADFIMGAVGYAGPVGCAISASYFIVTAAVDAKIAQKNEDK